MKPTMRELQNLVRMYQLTKSGTKMEVAKRIYSLRSIYLSMRDRTMLEDFLHISDSEKEKRKRIPLPDH